MKHFKAHCKSQLEHYSGTFQGEMGECGWCREPDAQPKGGALALLHAVKWDRDTDCMGGKLFYGKYCEPLCTGIVNCALINSV